MPMALEGLRILDLTRLLPGPSGTVILADLGAEVIKVEEPELRGGVGRDILSPAEEVSDAEEEKWAAYNCLARDKKSIALNLKLAPAREVFYRLARTADALVEGYRPGVAKELGIDYPTIAAIDPRIVYCSLSGYGQDGPYRDLPGHDPNYGSIAGVVAITSDREGRPVWTGVPALDIMSGLFVVIGVLVALRARDLTGRGQFVDLSMTDIAMHMTGFYLARYFRDGTVPQRGRPSVTVLETQDGKFITTANAEAHFWERFCRAIGRPDLSARPRRQPSKWAAAAATVQEIIRAKSRDEWVRILREADTCVAPVLELNEVAEDPQVRHRQMILELDHPAQGKVRQVGIPVKLSETPGQIRSFAPRLGQHTVEILRELDYTTQQIEELKAIGAVK